MSTLVWLHRWISVAVCLLFALWFLSGAVMLFVPFPSLQSQEGLQRAEPLNLARVHVTPAVALRAAPQATSLKLVSSLDRPYFIATRKGVVEAVVDAEDGRPRAMFGQEEARQIAERFGGSHALQVDSGIEYDQWVVHQGFDSRRPFFRVHLDDRARTVVYVAARTGEVVQKTTRRQRLLNRAGAVLHWIYFTPVRQHWSLWDSLVWWTSLVALLGAAIGFFLGVYRYVQSWRLRSGGFQLYRGWMRWHHIAGVFAGMFLLGWIFSGWLSMDHGRLFSTADIDERASSLFHGPDLRIALQDASLEALQRVAPPGTKTVRFGVIGGRGFAIGAGAGRDVSIQLVGAAGVLTRLPDSLLLAAGELAWPGTPVSLEVPGAKADLYAQAEEAPAGAAVLLVGLPPRRRVYVDSHTGEVVAVLDESRRAYAWAYYALHTYRFPFLAPYENLRKALVLILLTAGFGLSVTGSVLACRRLSRPDL